MNTTLLDRLGRRGWPGGNVWRVLPVLALVVVVFDFSLAGLLTRAVLPADGTFTLAYFHEAWTTPAYLRVLTNTVRVSVAATAACVLLGYPLAYWMRGLDERRRSFTIAIVLVTFWVSILVRTYAWIVVLGNSGLVNRFLLASGWIDAPIQILYAEPGVTIGMANVLLPFFVLPMLAAMTRIDARLLHAAESLGASPATVFWRIFFPLTLPALGACVLLLFMLCLGFYVTPAILGGGKVPLLGNLLDTLINETSQWELAAAMSATLLGFALVVFWVYLRLNRLAESV